MLIQLFTPVLLLKVLWLKSLSSEVYYSRLESQTDVVILALIRIASLKITRLWKC